MRESGRSANTDRRSATAAFRSLSQKAMMTASCLCASTSAAQVVRSRSSCCRASSRVFGGSASFCAAPPPVSKPSRVMPKTDREPIIARAVKQLLAVRQPPPGSETTPARILSETRSITYPVDQPWLSVSVPPCRSSLLRSWRGSTPAVPLPGPRPSRRSTGVAWRSSSSAASTSSTTIPSPASA